MGASVPDLLDSSEFVQLRSIASVSTNVSSAHHNYFSDLISRVIHYHHRQSGKSNSFLHVTVDRLLFVTISQGRKPALIASWNFTNGEISVYGTGRVSTSGDSENKVFYLMEAAGRYIFACDKATELSAWIQRATRPASYLYERRWLSSVASQLGEDQAILLMPFGGDRERRVFDASLKETSKVQTGGSQQTSSCLRNDQIGSPSSAYIHQVLERVSYRTRIRFLSHPTDRPVLSTRQLHKGRQQDGYILRRSYSNVSTVHDTNSHHHHHILAECFSCRAYTSNNGGSDQQTPAMVALSPLPLNYLPHSTEDEKKLESKTEARGWEHSAAVGSNRSSATSPSIPLFQLSSPSPTSAVPHRSTRLRLSNSWSTSLGHSPCIVSASSSTRGDLMTAPCARASSECRCCGSCRGQQWQREMSHSLLIGATCSVPWDAVATGEKPRTGRLYSSRDEIREAALKAVTTDPLSSLPSAGTFSCSGSFSERDDDDDDDDDVGNLATSGGHEQISFTSTDATSAAQSRSSPSPASSPPPPPPPPLPRSYVNLGPNSLSSLSDGSSAHRMTAMVTASVCASPATDFTIAAPPSTVEWVSRSANYLSYTPYVPLSRQGSSGHGRSGCRIRTLSSGQPSARRNPMLLTRHPIYDRSQQSSCLPSQTLSSLPLAPSPTDVSDAAKLISLQSQSVASTNPPSSSLPAPMMMRRPALHHSTEAISLAETVMGDKGGSDNSGSTTGKLHSNYVVIDFVETHAPSRLMQHMSAVALTLTLTLSITLLNVAKTYEADARVNLSETVMSGIPEEDLDKIRSFFKETSGTSNNGYFIGAIDFTEWTAKMDTLDPEDLKTLYTMAMFLFDQPKVSGRRNSSKLNLKSSDYSIRRCVP
ncbi:hypothetical protein TcWFU_000035 [Taenia crassiceps]|uniref:PH domain-containing protein n=1 Tax=Taenia crassiceps TaxID=6207 RepID=A0ABR4Q5K7_9CEST